MCNNMKYNDVDYNAYINGNTTMDMLLIKSQLSLIQLGSVLNGANVNENTNVKDLTKLNYDRIIEAHTSCVLNYRTLNMAMLYDEQERNCILCVSPRIKNISSFITQLSDSFSEAVDVFSLIDKVFSKAPVA